VVSVYPHLNPLHKSNPATRVSAPEVVSNNFNATQRLAEITLATGKTKLKEAYLLVEIPNQGKSKKKSKKGDLYEKLPVTINYKDMTVTGDIPKEYDSYLFVLIDENNFLVKSKLYKL